MLLDMRYLSTEFQVANSSFILSCLQLLMFDLGFCSIMFYLDAAEV